MKKIVIASTNRSAGKTSMVIGLAKVMGKKAGYIKPFGDRLLYKKKRLWDHDSALVTGVLELDELPEDMSIGFEHAKLKYMYDADATKKKLEEMASHNGKGKDVLFIEGGNTLGYGVAVHLDPITVARTLGASLLLVASGDDASIVDDIIFVKKYVDISGVDFAGVIINKIKDKDDFDAAYLGDITGFGVKVLGVVPYRTELSYFTMGYLAEALFAKVIAGEGRLGNEVKRVLIGAMSGDTAISKPFFHEEGKIVITGGDRTDMILAAIEAKAVGIILTNNILPPSNIISKVAEKNIPMLLAASDTYRVAQQIDRMEPMITKDEPEKVALLEKLVKENVTLPL